MAEESGTPGTCRSKVGCEAIDEPCTNKIVPAFSGALVCFSHRNSRTSPLRVQCSSPWTAGVAPIGLFMGQLPDALLCVDRRGVLSEEGGRNGTWRAGRDVCRASCKV